MTSLIKRKVFAKNRQLTDVNLTQVAAKALCTVTRIAVHCIYTRAVIVTHAHLTVVNVDATLTSSKAIYAYTREATNGVKTGPVVFTWCAQTVVNSCKV